MTARRAVARTARRVDPPLRRADRYPFSSFPSLPVHVSRLRAAIAGLRPPNGIDVGSGRGFHRSMGYDNLRDRLIEARYRVDDRLAAPLRQRWHLTLKTDADRSSDDDWEDSPWQHTRRPRPGVLVTLIVVVVAVVAAAFAARSVVSAASNYAGRQAGAGCRPLRRGRPQAGRRQDPRHPALRRLHLALQAGARALEPRRVHGPADARRPPTRRPPCTRKAARPERGTLRRRHQAVSSRSSPSTPPTPTRRPGWPRPSSSRRPSTFWRGRATRSRTVTGRSPPAH